MSGRVGEAVVEVGISVDSVADVAVVGNQDAVCWLTNSTDGCADKRTAVGVAQRTVDQNAHRTEFAQEPVGTGAGVVAGRLGAGFGFLIEKLTCLLPVEVNERPVTGIAKAVCSEQINVLRAVIERQ